MSFLICGDRKFAVGERTLIMGIVNITPDSFSDKGLYYNVDDALAHALSLLEDGADILDIGGVATSPYRQSVSEDEELKRVLPVVQALVKKGITNLSIDTSKALVAQKCLAAGASWINDQHAALKDPLMPIAYSNADAVIIMHNVGLSGVAAGESVHYKNVVDEVKCFFMERIAALKTAGVAYEKIIVDPGIGFGKGLSDSLKLINGMSHFNEVAHMSLIGLSRKSFLEPLTGIKEPKARDQASLGATAAAIIAGAHIVRTHNVKATCEMVRVFEACNKERKANNENLYQDGRPGLN